MATTTGAGSERQWIPLAEVAAMSAVLLSYIWLWHGRFPGDFSLCLTLYFGLGVAGHWLRRESPREIGLRLDNLQQSVVDAARITLPLVLLISLLGLLAGSLTYPPLESWPERLGRGWVWGTMQQYGLTAFFYRRFFEVSGSGAAATASAATLFALFHLPNAFLMLVTLAAGALACWLYRRHPNLLVLGLVHALISFSLLHSLPAALTLRLRVGP